MAEDQHTKIVATLGPSCASAERLRELIARGLDVARVNGSHGDHATQGRWMELVRQAAEVAQKPVALLYDLQGPKIRIGDFSGPPRVVAAGDELILAVRRSPAAGELPADYAELDRDVQVGEPLLIDDGHVATQIVEVRPGAVRCRVENAGTIKPRKGINLPKSQVSAPALTEKDGHDVRFAVAQGVDFLALSFVRRAADVEVLETLLHELGADIPIIAKIEKPQALTNLPEILQRTWGVMVARGDLGVELSPQDVPLAQKRIIHEANRLGRPVITATQMLESMTEHPRPTRAEASDVANAVLDGTDAVMLSGETAIGKYPVESVAMMARIIQAIEEGAPARPWTRRHEAQLPSTPEAVADACCQVAQHLGAKLIAVFTQTGRTAVLISERRPNTPIVAFTPDPRVRTRLAVVWGVRPVLLPPSRTLEERSEHLEGALLRTGLCQKGDVVVLSMGAPMAPPGSTNLMMVHQVGSGLFK